MRCLFLGLVGLVGVSGYVIGCGSTSGSAAGNNLGGSGGTGVGANGGAVGVGGSGANGGSSANGGTGATGGSSAGGAGGGSGATGPQDAGPPDVVFSYDGPSDDGGFNTDASCAEVTAKAEPLPLDLYVVLDRSGSMTNAGRWVPVRNALTTFFESPGAAGIGAALTMFAHPTQDECSAATYATPLVAMAPLPGSATGQALTLVNKINQYPSLNGILTPTVQAATGAVTYAKNYKNAHPKDTVVIVLATDGLPSDPSCGSESAAQVQAAVANGYNGTPSIRTFVIGIDPTAAMQTNLNSWAAAGGGQAFDAATSGGPAQFLAAMQAIQKSALGCSYNMPTSDAGIVDPNKVNVEYTKGGTTTPQSLPKVNGSGSCGSGGGWYYDNNSNPTTITLCKTTCDTVQADSGAKVAVNLGCLGS